MFKKALFLFMGLLMAPAVMGYEFAPESFVEKSPLPEKKLQTDDNGDYLSVVRIKSNIPGLQLSNPQMAGLKQVKGGYELSLPYGRENVLLRAPGFKSLRWEVGSLKPGFLYEGKVGQKGENAGARSLQDTELQGSFEYNMWDLSVRLSRSGDFRPMIKINTDLPFSFVQQYLLLPDTYEITETELAPYAVRVKAGLTPRDVLRQGVVKGNIDWDMALEPKNVYVLDLSWVNKQYAQELAQSLSQSVRQEKKKTSK